MKILFVSYAFYPQVGGIESSAQLFLREFQNHGHDVTVLTATELGEAAELPEVEVHRQPSIRHQRELARSRDLIYHHNPSLRFIAAGFGQRKPTVVSVRTWIQRPDGSLSIEDRIKRFWLRGQTVIANSRATAESLPCKSTVIENAYDATVFQNSTSWEERKGALFVGRLVSDKGADVAVEAVALLASRGIELPLTVIGDGPERTALEEKVRATGVSHLVAFLGRRKPPEICTIANRHRYQIIPSRWSEPFGIVALEASASGCIPIGTNQGGLVDAIGPCGPLFARDDITGLTDILERLETDSDAAEGYRATHAAHLRDHSPEVVANEYLKVFESSLR